MKNSKGQTLPQPYFDLAMMLREQQAGSDYRNRWNAEFEKTSSLVCAFNWGYAGGYDWWHAVYEGKTPVIPASSLAELEAWRKSREENKQSEFWGKAAMVADELRPEPDYKAMYEDVKGSYEILDKSLHEALEKLQEQTSRNWIAECAMRLFSTGVSLELSWDKAQKWAAEGKKREHLPNNQK